MPLTLLRLFRPSILAGAIVGLSAGSAAAQNHDAGARPSGAIEIEQPMLIDQPGLGFRLPPGFRATVFHQGIENLRFFAVSSENVVYVIRNKRGLFGPGLYALKDDDGDGVADRAEGFGNFAGSGIAIRTDEEGREWLYASATREVFRWQLRPGDLAPSGRRERVVHGFPRNGVEHPWKPIAFDGEGGMYIMVGAPSNACMEQRRTRGSPGMDPCPQLERQAGVWRFDADRLNQRQEDGEHFATGLRNAIAFAWSTRQDGLYAAQHGRDFLNRYFPELFTQREGAELPSEEFHRIDRGDHLGWPYSYYDQIAGERRIAPEYEPEGTPGRGRNRTEAYKRPVYGFPAHWAPSGLDFFEADTGFPDIYREGAFIAFKGGWGRNIHPPQEGYRDVFLPLHEGELAAEPIVFANGFEGPRPPGYPPDLPFPASRNDGALSPQGLAFGPDGAMYLGDAMDLNIWRITYEGDAAAERDRERAELRAEIDARILEAIAPKPGAGLMRHTGTDHRPLGQRVYDTECAACHQRDGGGVDGFAPPLAGSRILERDPGDLAYFVLNDRGPSDRWSTVMPGYRFGPLSAEELAAALTYARERFAGEGAVDVSDVEEALEAFPDSEL